MPHRRLPRAVSSIAERRTPVLGGRRHGSVNLTLRSTWPFLHRPSAVPARDSAIRRSNASLGGSASVSPCSCSSRSSRSAPPAEPARTVATGRRDRARRLRSAVATTATSDVGPRAVRSTRRAAGPGWPATGSADADRRPPRDGSAARLPAGRQRLGEISRRPAVIPWRSAAARRAVEAARRPVAAVRRPAPIVDPPSTRGPGGRRGRARPGWARERGGGPGAAGAGRQRRLWLPPAAGGTGRAGPGRAARSSADHPQRCAPRTRGHLVRGRSGSSARRPWGPGRGAASRAPTTGRGRGRG